LQVTFASPTICNCLFHIFGLSTLPNVVKETALAMALNIGEKKRGISGQTSQRSLQDEARLEVCFSQIGPAGAAQLLPRSGWNLIATTKVQLLQGRLVQDFQQVCGPIGTFGVTVKAPGVLKRGRWGYTNPVGGWHIEKGTFMPSKPQSSKNLAFVGGRPYYHLDGAKCKIYYKPQKVLA